jgi:hypothetical protein
MIKTIFLVLTVYLISCQGLENDCTVPDSTDVIPDCNCKHETVEYAVSSFIQPTLSEICNS